MSESLLVQKVLVDARSIEPRARLHRVLGVSQSLIPQPPNPSGVLGVVLYEQMVPSTDVDVNENSISLASGNVVTIQHFLSEFQASGRASLYRPINLTLLPIEGIPIRLSLADGREPLLLLQW